MQFVSVRDGSLPVPAGGSSDSESAVLSADGRYVLFESMAGNFVVISNPAPVSGLSPQRVNVFLRDRLNGTTTLVSANQANNGGGNGDSFASGISTNGQFALFVSSATNLVSGDTNNFTDVFLRNLVSKTSLLVSVSSTGGSGNGASRNATMTPDGRYIAFVSAATNLVSGDTNGIPDIFVRDRQSGTTTLVSIGAKSTGSAFLPGASSEAPAITPDGRYVAFYSSATNLVAGITNVGEIYVRDLILGTTTMASTNARAILYSITGTSNGVSCNHQISVDGQYVAFVIGTNSSGNAYSRGVALRHNLQTSNTDIIHTNANVPFHSYEDIRNLSMTPDGRFVAFVANTNVSSSALCVLRWDAQAGDSILVSGDTNNSVAAGTFCDWPQMDVGGRYVAFYSNATDLTTNTLSGTVHLFLRDMQTGTTRLINSGTNDVGYEVNSLVPPLMSADGQVVVFGAADGGLVANDNNEANDVFAHDIGAAATEMISARHSTLPAKTIRGNNDSGIYTISSDGRFVAFTSVGAPNSISNSNGFRHVFVRDLFLSTNHLVSVATNGLPGNGNANTLPSISGDGRYVAFSSYANNLVEGDTNGFADVFVWDRQTGTCNFASVKTNSNASGDSNLPVISSDGRYITFRSTSQNLTTATTTPFTENLFQRDLQTGVTRALTTAGGGNWAQTPDGGRVAFVGRIPNDFVDKVYVWDSSTANRIYTNTTSTPFLVGISANGQRLVFLAGTQASAPNSLYAVDLTANTSSLVSTGVIISPWGLKLSADGRFMPYSTVAPKFNDSNGTNDVWLYDFQTVTNIQVCRRYDSVQTPNGPSDWPDISSDGRFVAYRSRASNAVINDQNNSADVLLFDRISGATYPVTRAVTGNIMGNNFSTSSAFSSDGRMLIFSTWASDLLGGDFNTGSDIVVLSLATSAIKDSDGDGMDDTWETNYFGNLSHNGSVDSDGDGVSDLFEFQNYLNPTNKNSAFRAELAVGPNLNLSWPAMPWRSYRIQYKNHLADGSWQDLNSNLTLVGTNGAATDPLPDANQRFYRILLNP